MLVSIAHYWVKFRKYVYLCFR